MVEEWTSDDLKELTALVQEHGCKWRTITTEHFPNCLEDSVCNEYKRAFSPPSYSTIPSTTKSTRLSFSADDDEELVRLVLQHGCKWRQIASDMSHKRASGLRCFRNRWSRYLRHGHVTKMNTILKDPREVGIVLRSLP